MKNMKENVVIICLSLQSEKGLINLINKELLSGNRLSIITKGFNNQPLKGLIKQLKLYSINDFITEDDYQRVDFQIKDFVERLPSSDGNSRFKKIVTYKGHSLWQVIEYALFWLFLPIGQYKLITENIIRQEKPARMVILGVKSPVIFWRNVEMGLADRKLLRNIASFLNNSRKGNLEEDVMFQVAKKHGINVKLEGNCGFVADIRYRISSFLLPKLLNLYLWYSRFRRCVFEKKRVVSELSSSTSVKKKIVAFVQTRNIAVAAVPVIQELMKDNRNKVVVIRAEGPAGTVVKSMLDSEGIPYKNYESYITGALQKQIRQGSGLLRSSWKQLKTDEGFVNSLKYEDILLWPAMKDLFGSIFTALLPEAMKYIEVARHIIEVEKPICLLLADELSPLERAVGLVAKRMKIPSIMVTCGATTKREPPVQWSVDKVCVWGQMTMDLISRRRGNSNTFVITGNPAFEYQMNKLKNFDKDLFCKKIGLNIERAIVIFTSEAVADIYTSELREMNTIALYRAFKQLPEVQFVTKLHPAEHADFHNQLIQKLGLKNVIIVKYVSVYELFSVCQLMITAISTTAVEAMLLARPVITINMNGKPSAMPFASSGAALGVYREEDLVPAIKAALYDEETQKRLAEKSKEFLYKYAYPQDGKAARRVADLVLQMCTKSGS